MSPESACCEPDARGIVSPDLNAIGGTFREVTEGFLAEMDAMERRMIQTMVYSMLGGVLTVAMIGLIVLAVAA